MIAGAFGTAVPVSDEKDGNTENTEDTEKEEIRKGLMIGSQGMTDGKTEATEDHHRNSGSATGHDAAGLLHAELTGTIRQTAFDVHGYFGPGFLERVYEGALANRLGKRGLEVSRQVGISVSDEDGTVVGTYVADLLVEKTVIVEIKAAQALTNAHRAQLLNYLRATGMRVGMLLNFGPTGLQVKRVVL